ncbi:flagellar basal body M-ring protein FliF [Legionella taurinensis]|uniref:Flagellar M-ring protein n=1 Tax=Legionella taurinensis TaxID=70611 RepID=A0A3A5LEX3_9GAMM|nr:flagellar basal-body MS-ring/collar protein FliF [Legionella taurinensis]MDX1836609.1 flagellar basal-body MS-ring/collar protein FliF [Legionella taurinensis]PUT42932.1 flagellar basal body M-ring protein FliF [Legionella taurinensis]PUT45487.1 flagellar basal body M-ring protein FliF [Legionella taurinensis]PUT46938.1 flagellar basal body M-ring protein FliF [Legionella taurinensis]PUT49254.1 flagellar basal body M-ring protein FliF [Legionella taurinensis]
MALADSASKAAAKFASLSIMRQLGLLVGLAASVAIGLGVVLWSREPSYMPLYSQLSNRDSADVVDVLQRNAISFKVDETNGMILVPTNQVQAARMKLAAEGLPRGSGGSFELFAGNNSFSTSQFMENARYIQALEAELARTISQFHDIKSARVHLAIPRESAFVRDTRQPSASVFIDVYSGVEIKKQTIASIINLVASSIPSLSASRVTVVDQNGQLLSEGGGQTLFTETERFLDYRQTLEQQYAQKIQDILTPLLGYGRVSAKVSADIDFTSYEQTQEMYNPEMPAVRSEQLVQDNRNVGPNASSGVPGALSNTPPANSTLTPVRNRNINSQAMTNQDIEANMVHKESTKNFELDKTISHTKNQPGTIRRLTVAVLVDNRSVMNEKTKKMEVKPLSKAELDQVKALVADAIGLNAERGDSLNVVNSNFVKPEPIESLPEPRFWQKDSFWSIIKQVLSGLFVLTIVFGVLRPLFKTLAHSRREEESGSAETQAALSYEGKGLPPNLSDYDQQLHLLRQVVDKEPKRVAQVVKTWVDRG